MRQHATVSYTGGERWMTEKAGKPGEKRPRLRWIKRMALLKQDKNNRTRGEDDDDAEKEDDNDAYRVYLEGRGKKRASRKLQGNDKTGNGWRQNATTPVADRQRDRTPEYH
jgi:hypothetical protein